MGRKKKHEEKVGDLPRPGATCHAARCELTLRLNSADWDMAEVVFWAIHGAIQQRALAMQESGDTDLVADAPYVEALAEEVERAINRAKNRLNAREFQENPFHRE